nr:MarR family transcriptional regulator [Francisella halioticida]
MSDISNKLLFTDGGTTKIIKRLASRGLIKQERSNKDKRVIFIDITSIGVNKLSDALDTMVSVACPLIEETFTLYECKTLTKLLEKFENTIQYLQTN